MKEMAEDYNKKLALERAKMFEKNKETLATMVGADQVGEVVEVGSPEESPLGGDLPAQPSSQPPTEAQEEEKVEQAPQAPA